MLHELIIENTWWETGSVPESLNPPIKRYAYDAVVKELDNDRITALIGPRRVGKSTLMYQVIDHLLKNARVPAKRICFLSLENPLLDFDGALKVYLSEILNEPLKDLKSRIYLFVDEIHFFEGWNRRLKRFVDLKLPVKIIVSGSSATHLSKGSTETLAGRITEKYIHSLDFGEFIRFSDPSLYAKVSYLEGVDVFSSDAGELFSHKTDAALHADALYAIFQKFRKKGGFIPYISLEFPEYHRLVRSDIVEKTIYKDLPIAYKVRSPLSLERIFTYLCLHSAETLNYQNVSKEFGISLPSVEKYIHYLEMAYFAATAKNILPSGKPALRSSLKAYLADLSLKRALARGIEDEGLEVETIVFNNIHRKALERGWRVYYWNHQKDEVDIVISTETGFIPVEVKFRRDIRQTDLKGLIKFMDIFKVGTGYVITRDDLKVEVINGKKMIFIPAYLLW